jgi:hypothetical protein
MGYAEHRSVEEQHRGETRNEEGKVLGASEVLDLLRAESTGDHDRRRIVGIGNGLVIGAVLWAALVAVVFIIWR